MEGNDGMDDRVGQAGEGVMDRGDGDDTQQGGLGADTMSGGAGNDDMRCGAADDTLDSIDGVGNNDRLDGNTGTNTCLSDPDPEVNCES